MRLQGDLSPCNLPLVTLLNLSITKFFLSITHIFFPFLFCREKIKRTFAAPFFIKQIYLISLMQFCCETGLYFFVEFRKMK
jgi:hypothetical protein